VVSASRKDLDIWRKNITNSKPNQTKLWESNKEREMGSMVVTTRDKKSVCMCVCVCVCVSEGETGDQNKDAKERGVREQARNGEDGNDNEREEERLYVCVWRRNRGPKQGRKTEGSARPSVVVFFEPKEKGGKSWRPKSWEFDETTQNPLPLSPGIWTPFGRRVSDLVVPADCVHSFVPAPI
jgi:hypothetical protein